MLYSTLIAGKDMYAIIKVGNQQFRVEQDLEFVSQRTGREVGLEFETPALLLLKVIRSMLELLN